MVSDVPVRYGDLELKPLDLGVEFDRTTIFRWIHMLPSFETRIRSHLRMNNGSRRVGETYMKFRESLGLPVRTSTARPQH